MNQSQFVHELMEHLFGWDYEYLADEDCSYILALGMIKEAFNNKEIKRPRGANGQEGLVTIHTADSAEKKRARTVRRPSLRETQAMQAYNRGGY